MQKPRVVIADDHTLIGELCKKLLEGEFDIVRSVGNGRDLVRAVFELKPDLAVVDIAMPILNGLDAARQIKQAFPTIKLIFLTMTKDADVAAEAFLLGASAFLPKTCASTELIKAARDVLRGKTYLSPQISKDTVDFLRRRHQRLVEEEKRLTIRQREVLQLLAEGKVMKEVGDILNMTTRTVAFHKYRMMEQLGAKSSADLVKYAVRNNMTAA